MTMDKTKLETAVAALKKEVPKWNPTDVTGMTSFQRNQNKGWNAAIDAALALIAQSDEGGILDQLVTDLMNYGHSIVRINPKDVLVTPPSSQGEDDPYKINGYSDETVRFAIRVEKKLCALLGREWSASGISIETLTEDIKRELDRSKNG